MTPAPQSRTPGMPCPTCQFFIEMPITDLLYARQFVCPGCGLRLSLDRGASRDSLQAIQQLHVALQNVEDAKRGFSVADPSSRAE